MIETSTELLIANLPAKPLHIKILQERLSGKKLEELGQSNGFTRERARQIIKKTFYMLPAKARVEVFLELERISHHGENSVKFARQQRRELVAKLKHGLRSKFDRSFVLRMFKSEPRLGELTNEEICAWLYAECGLKRFGGYLRCCGCTTVKPLLKFYPAARKGGTGQTAYCAKCANERTRMVYHTNENVRKYCREYQARNKNRNRIHCLRCYYKKQGRFSEMPPLPPAGTPDGKIVIQRGSGWSRMTPAARQDKLRKMAAGKAAKRAQIERTAIRSSHA